MELLSQRKLAKIVQHSEEVLPYFQLVYRMHQFSWRDCEKVQKAARKSKLERSMKFRSHDHLFSMKIDFEYFIEYISL